MGIRHIEFIELKNKLAWGLRPCIVYGFRDTHAALFHRWVDESRLNSNKIINHDPRIDDHLKTYALVEICETGAVWYCKPQDLVFVDNESFLEWRKKEINQIKELIQKFGGTE